MLPGIQSTTDVQCSTKPPYDMWFMCLETAEFTVVLAIASLRVSRFEQEQRMVLNPDPFNEMNWLGSVEVFMIMSGVQLCFTAHRWSAMRTRRQTWRGLCDFMLQMLHLNKRCLKKKYPCYALHTRMISLGDGAHITVIVVTVSLSSSDVLFPKTKIEWYILNGRSAHVPSALSRMWTNIGACEYHAMWKLVVLKTWWLPCLTGIMNARLNCRGFTIQDAYVWNSSWKINQCTVW